MAGQGPEDGGRDASLMPCSARALGIDVCSVWAVIGPREAANGGVYQLRQPVCYTELVRTTHGGQRTEGNRQEMLLYHRSAHHEQRANAQSGGP